MKKATATLLSVLVLAACGKAETPATAPKNTAAPAVSEPAQQEPATLVEAIEMVKPMMTDTSQNLSDGAVLLARWSMNHLNWAELNALPDSKRALVMKDSSEQRGKKICVSGSVIEINAENVGDKKVYEGGMYSGSYDVYRFIAVNSTGDIAEKSRAKFCGVVIGKFDYSNSAGGVAHAVQLVGMFDLPENKGAAAKK
jgi:hypothetical protein